MVNKQPVVVLSANTAWYLYNFRAATIRALQANGFEVVCIAPDDGYGPKITAELNAQWLPLIMDNQGSNPVKDLAVFWQLFKAYRRLKPSAVLHFTIKNNVYGTWAAACLGIPALNNVSGLGTAFIHRGLVPTIVKLLYKVSFPLAHTVFCQNPEDYRLLTEKGLVPSARLTQLPGSGANITRFHPSLRVQDSQRPFTFLYAGRMLADKGLRELVEAMAVLAKQGHQCRLQLCGFTDVKNITAISSDELARWQQQDNIDYIGATDDMAAVLAKVDAVVLPSYREGMPKALLEAGAMGLASVTTDVAGCRSVIRSGFNGFLCDVKNPVALAQAMQQLMTLPADQRQQLEHNAREHIEQYYSEQRVVALTLKALSAAVGRPLQYEASADQGTP